MTPEPRYQKVFDVVFGGQRFAPPSQFSFMLSMLDDFEVIEMFKLFSERWRNCNSWARFNVYWPCHKCEKFWSCLGSADICEFLVAFGQRLKGIRKISVCSFCYTPFLAEFWESTCPVCREKLGTQFQSGFQSGVRLLRYFYENFGGSISASES